MLGKLKKLQTEKANQKGFTIIEVLIVLAIAALIILVVLLAVPALQRSQRNNGRASEASRYTAEVTNFVANNQGKLPTSAADVTSITSAFGPFKYMLSISAPTTTVSKLTAGNIGITTKTGFTAAPVTSSGNKDAMEIVTGATCGTPGTSATVNNGSPSNFVVLYTTESSGADYNEVCIQGS